MKQKKIKAKDILKQWKDLPEQKKDQAYRQQVAEVQANILNQIINKHHPDWTMEQAMECCTSTDPNVRDVECSMWWKLSEYFPCMTTKSDKLKVREIAGFDEEELKVYDEKIMPLHLISMREAAVPSAVKKFLLGK